VSCPHLNKYTVYLSELLVNSTLSDIHNEIRGYDDSEQRRYDEQDYIRVLNFRDVEIESVTKSKELEYPDAVIVIVKNETKSRPRDGYHQYSAWRYWQDGDWIRSEYMFESAASRTTWYETIEVFDDYAIG